MMTLSTTSQQPIISPLATILPRAVSSKSAQEQAQTVRSAVGLAEIATWQILDIRGADAETVLSAAFATPSMGIGAVTGVTAGLLVRLRRDQFALLTPDLPAALERLTAPAEDALLTLTDISHGRGVIFLGGAQAAAVLSKVCGLDFMDAKFPNLFAAQTSLAKVRALIVRFDTAQTPAFYVIVDRSLTAYVWDVLVDAAHEFGGIVLSQDTLAYLKK